jgi:DNA primase catalytic core
VARIPDEQIERLKQEVSLERLAESAGVELKRHGADLIGRCPFHDDREPSLVISPAKNLWHCLGECNTGGTVIDWVMKARGISFRHAVELLKADLPLVAPAAPVKRSTVRHLDAPFSPDADDRAALAQVFGYYHETLKQSAEALSYLEKRGISSRDAIEHFQLGYANRTLSYRLPAKPTKEGAALRGRLQRLGMMRPSGHEHFNGSIVFPIFDAEGQIVQAYGRKIREDLRPGTPLHLYLPGDHQGVWNLDGLKDAEEVILCEALIDALTFWCAGFRNVTASYGVNGFTPAHVAAFKEHGIKRVLIAYDRDEAGEKAARELAPQLQKEGFDCFRIEFPKNMDANAYALNVQPASKSLGLVIRAAVWMGNGAAPQVPTTEAIPTTITEPDEAQPEEDAPAESNLAKDEHFQRQLAEVAEKLKVFDKSSSSLVADPQSEPEPLPAQRVPRGAQEIPAEVSEEEIAFTFGDRRYRVRGFARNASYESLRVNLLASRDAPQGVGALLHVDTFDLYSARHRATFIKEAGLELGVKEEVIKRDLGAVLLKLEAMQDERIKQAQTPKETKHLLSTDEEREALALLKDPQLLPRILADFAACGVVGEETNKLVGYLAAVSRKLDRPLAVLVQSTSAAGKSSLMDAVLAFVPEEERIQYSAMTGQALYYMGNLELKHKVLALAEEEGASRAAYALKLLQSEGRLTIASTGKDPLTGELTTRDYTVEGPVMMFMTTTAIDIDEELMNRCLVLAVDEAREQTRAIHQRQREAETLEGLIAKDEREHLLKLHQNAQRLLKPLAVANPYAPQLTFPDTATRTRRDHTKYLALIRAIALLHQHQRPIKNTLHRGEAKAYIEVTLEDIATANRLAHEVLGRTLDELPPQTRRLLLLVEQMVKAACEKLSLERADYRFSRREVREYSGWGDTQLRLHLERLISLEYLLVHKGGRGQSFVYELLYDGQGKDGKPFLPGLIDVEKLKDAPMTERSRGADGAFAGSSRPQRGAVAGPSRVDENSGNTEENGVCEASEVKEPENAYIGANDSARSYLTEAAKGAA